MKAFVSQLIQISHSQWIFQNYTLHNKQRGYICLRERSDVLQEVHKLLNTASPNIPKESQYLLELDHSTLYNVSYKRQAYWILAMQVARCTGRQTAAWEKAGGGLQWQWATKVAGQRIWYYFSKLTKRMQHELGLAEATRCRSYPTSPPLILHLTSSCASPISAQPFDVEYDKVESST